MANGKPAISFDEIIQEGRKKRQAERLAQEIFGKNRRSSAPPNAPKATLGGSLASRVGISKRNSSIPRSGAPRTARPQAHVSRPPTNDNYRSRPPYTQPISDPVSDSKSNGHDRDEAANGGDEVSFKGAASGPYVVVAQNFAPGTTAADIESVMLSVGGQMQSCRLVASNPTVIAEMAFLEKAGAEKVIDTFNNKKADGRTLYVYSKHGGAAPKPSVVARTAAALPEPTITPLAEDEAGDVMMAVDEVAESREAENRRREERRGRDERTDRIERSSFPEGPKAYQNDIDNYYNRQPRRAEESHQDGRYGFRGSYRDGGHDRFPRGDVRRFGRGQSWRPY